jgi:hypothetical protein
MSQHEENMREANERRSERRELLSIGENTPIRLGLLLAIMALILGGIISGTWWASGITHGVNSLLQSQSSTTAEVAIIKDKEAEVEAWEKLVEVTGTPGMASQMKTMNESLVKLRQDFEMEKLVKGSKP